MSALSSKLLVFVLASFLLVGTTSSVVSIGYVRAEDSGSDSSGSSSGGDSGSSGGSSDNGDSGSSDKGSNDNGNSDKGDKGPKGPSKEDTKDLTSDDPKVEPNIPTDPTMAHCDSIGCNPNDINQPQPQPQPQPTIEKPIGCPVNAVCSLPPPHPIHCPPGFHLKHHTCERNIVINIHTHNHGSSSGGGNSNTHSEISDNCYSQIKIAWIGKIQRGSNQAVDSIIDRCMGLA